MGTNFKIKQSFLTALTVSTALTLSACGGGGSGTAATTATPTTSLSVTPGKGIMIGATVEIRDANNNLLGSGPTLATGIASVPIPATATGPFIVSVICQTSACTYYDEKSGLNVSGTAAMPALQAVVPVLTTNIGVTAATNAAAQYALNSGAPLTANSITTANTVVRTSLNLPAGTDLLTPPTIIKDAASYALAKAGTKAADLLADISAAFAMSAKPGVSAMQAIDDYGKAWKQAAITPASGVIMPPSIDTAALTLAASGIPTTTLNAASAVATASTNVTAVNDLYTTGSSASGLRVWFPTGASGVAADIISVTPGTTANTYTYTGVTKELTGGAWSVAPVGKYSNYTLTPTGWVSNANLARSILNNNDGTLTITNAQNGTFTVTVQENVLDGLFINSVTTGLPLTATYPVGSRGFAGLGGVTSKDLYGLWNNNGANSSVTNHIWGVTDITGATMATIPTLGSTFCANGFVLNPITTLTQALATSQGAAASDNYEILGTAGGCTSTSISTALQVKLGNTIGGIGMGFATLTNKTTGNAVVPSVGFLKSVSTNTANASAAPFLAGANGCIIGVAGGVAEVGCPGSNSNAGFIPAGTAIPNAINSENKIAVDAELIANGFIALP